MSGLALLDVGIGMVFLYLLLSLICSALNESIATVLEWRAHFLEQGIRRLLDSSAVAEQFYNHALIRNLYPAPGRAAGWIGRRKLPPYIPSRSFALALMDLIQPGTGTRHALTAPSSAGAPSTGLLAALQQPDCALPDGVKQAIRVLVTAAGEDAVRTRQSIEDWFNSTMERVSGAYKRRTHYVLFILGILVSIVVNADSVAIAQRLTALKSLPAVVAASAGRFVSSQEAAGKPVTENSLSSTLSSLDQLGLPLGWGGAPGPEEPNTLPLTAAQFFYLLKIHSAGWLLTALAISFGAPFWFDVLSRFMVVRTTIKPAATPEVS